MSDNKIEHEIPQVAARKRELEGAIEDENKRIRIDDPAAVQLDESNLPPVDSQDMSQLTEYDDDEETRPMGSGLKVELPELNKALVVFANKMATVNDEIVEALSEGDESVSSARSGSSASIDDTIESNASSASTEIEAFFAPQLPVMEFSKVGELFNRLATAFGDAATKVSSYVAPYATSTATSVSALPEPIRNQVFELSMAVSMLGVSQYLPNINMNVNVPGVNALLSSISSVSRLLSSYGVTASIVGIGLIAGIRSNLPANIIARIFTELTITEAGLNNVSFAAQESADKAKLTRAKYNQLKEDYEAAMEALINAIQNKAAPEAIAGLEVAMNAAKHNVTSAIDAAKSRDGGKRKSQKKQQKSQKKKQKQQKSQKKPKRKLSKSKRAKKAKKQSRKANKKH